MLRVPTLDDKNFEQLFEAVRDKIPTLTSEWTDFNLHDPGITTIQVLTWLIDMLNFYIDATGEKHRMGYLSLLGITPKLEAALAYVVPCSSRHTALGRGTKLFAGDVVFELDEAYIGQTNELTAVYYMSNNQLLDITPVIKAEDSYAVLSDFDAGGSSELYLCFLHSMSGNVKFFADIAKSRGRTDFYDDFFLTAYKYEYFNGTEWREAVLLNDGTGGFLREGFIELFLDNGTEILDTNPLLTAGHYLRIIPKKGTADAPVQLSWIYPDYIKAVQTDTISEVIEYTYDGSGSLSLNDYIGADTLICVAVEENDGFCEWFRFEPDETSLCDVIPGAYEWQRIVVFDEDRFGVVPKTGQKLVVTLTNRDYTDEIALGYTTGYAEDRLELKTENVIDIRLGLYSERNGRIFFQLWDKCDDLAAADYQERVFYLDRDNGHIVFGDGKHGVQPDRCQVVAALRLKTSLLDGGNVRAGQINRFKSNNLTDITITNPKPAYGGVCPKISNELEMLIEEKILIPRRVVTPEDYIKITKDTPGLRIDSVNVISEREFLGWYDGDIASGAVIIAVKPCSDTAARTYLSDAYKKRITWYLEAYRLLTVELRVVSVRYAGITVSGRIVLTVNSQEIRDHVNELIRELIDHVASGQFGGRISYGMLFSRLEMLECVSKVSDLHLICPGVGAKTNAQGDVLLAPDTISYLLATEIEFV